MSTILTTRRQLSWPVEVGNDVWRLRCRASLERWPNSPRQRSLKPTIFQWKSCLKPQSASRIWSISGSMRPPSASTTAPGHPSGCMTFAKTVRAWRRFRPGLKRLPSAEWASWCDWARRVHPRHLVKPCAEKPRLGSDSGYFQTQINSQK